MTTPKPDPITSIRLNVYRLAIPTHAPGTTSARRIPVTRDPLLAELRAAVRPDQGSTGSGRSASSSARIPLDIDALTLYQDITDQIGAIYEMGTDRRAVGTPEQLLIEWWIAFAAETDKPDQMLKNYADKLSRWRYRIESHFIRPRELELGMCPDCGYTHHLTVVDGLEVQQRTLVGTWWPDDPEKGITVRCRHCGYHRDGTELGTLELEVQLARVAYGDVTYSLAPQPDPDEATTNQENRRGQS